MKGLPLHIKFSQTVNRDMYMDVAAFVIAVCVCRPEPDVRGNSFWHIPIRAAVPIPRSICFLLYPLEEAERTVEGE